MSLESSAQFFEVVDPSPELQFNHGEDNAPLLVIDDSPSEEHSEDHELLVKEPLEVEIVIGRLPGAPEDAQEPQIEIEEEEDDSDENKAETKEVDKWSAPKKSEEFLVWVKERLDKIPGHSGKDTAGIERAISYMEQLDKAISKAMRTDLDGDLDANKIEEVRSKIDQGLEGLKERLNWLNDQKVGKGKKKKKAEFSPEFVKNAQKITGAHGTYVTVPLLISGIARVCINGVVSAGHDLTDLYKRQVEKYKLNDREKSEVKWLLHDMGFPLRGDRGFMLDNEEYDTSSSDNFDYMANYQS
jgi:hypothetical protein